MTLPRTLFNVSPPMTAPAATTMGEKTPSLCGFLPFFLGAAFLAMAAAGFDGATGMGGMSIINLSAASCAS